jgi:hypothetical protein
LDRLRAEYAQCVRNSPPHWYLPLSAVSITLKAVLREMAWAGRECHLDDMKAASLVATLASWRVTQGIYRFDASLFEALCATPISGPLPDEVLCRLPEWTVFLETPGMQWTDGPLYGVFAQVGDKGKGPDALFITLHMERRMEGT